MSGSEAALNPGDQEIRIPYTPRWPALPLLLGAYTTYLAAVSVNHVLAGASLSLRVRGGVGAAFWGLCLAVNLQSIVWWLRRKPVILLDGEGISYGAWSRHALFLRWAELREMRMYSNFFGSKVLALVPKHPDEFISQEPWHLARWAMQRRHRRAKPLFRIFQSYIRFPLEDLAREIGVRSGVPPDDQLPPRSSAP